MKLSRPRLAYPFRVLVCAVLAASAVLLPSGTASAADTTTPRLSSFSVSTTQVTPGQQITFSYVATEDSGSLSRLRLGYQDSLSLGPSDILTIDGPLPVAGAVTITVPDTWANGLVALQWVELSDPSLNRILYYRGGITAFPPGLIGPTSHTVPFAPGDVTVSGSTVDATVPTLSSVSVTGSPTSPGQTITGHYKAADASGSLSSVVLVFRDPYQNERSLAVQGTGSVPLSGNIDQVVPAAWANGTYLLYRVELTDAHGNRGDYYADGGIVLGRGRLGPPAPHHVPFGPATFTVSGSTADFTPPALTSLGLTSSTMAPGGTTTLSYTVTSQDPLTYVAFKYVQQTNPLGNQKVFGGPTTLLAGTQSVTIAVGSGIGEFLLEEVYLQDSVGNFITYSRDGTTTQIGRGFLAGTHAIAFRALDILVGTPPSAPTGISTIARSASASVFWNAADSFASPVTRYTITAQPGGRTITTSGSATQTELTGLTNGTTYRFAVKATNALGTGPASLSVAVTPRMSTNIVATGDFTGDRRNDLIGLLRTVIGTTYLYRGNGRGGFIARTRLSNTYDSSDRIVFSPGDFDSPLPPPFANGFSDILIVDSSGILWLQPGNGRGGFLIGGGRRRVSSGWGGMRTVFGPGDFSGDHKNDVMAVSSAGGLYLFRGNGRGGFAAAGQRIGIGWGNFLTVFSPGDFSGDGKTDVMAVSKNGGLYLFRGNGRGGFAAAGQRIGNGWGTFLSVFSPGDFSGDHRTDVMAVTSTGDLRLYRGNGRGGFAAAGQTIGKGWTVYR
jgi:hypothetical protein